MSRTLLATAAAALLVTQASAAPPAVVTDTAPVHSLVAMVMRDLGAPVLLMDRGGDAHAFQMRPSQARALAGADLLFWIGPELTPWLERALEGTGIAGEAVALLHAEGTQARVYGGGPAEAAQDEHGHDDHGHEAEHADEDEHAKGHEGHDHAVGGLDPHAWLDPANASAWVEVIAAHLAEADPENAAAYAANAATAQAELAALDARLRAALAPAAGRPLFVYHDAYGYFAATYGLTIAGSLAEGDAAEPGAAGFQALKAALVAAEAPCVFAEADHDPGSMQVLAEGTGLTVGLLDPSGVTLAPGPELYPALMTALAEAVAACGG